MKKKKTTYLRIREEESAWSLVWRRERKEEKEREHPCIDPSLFTLIKDQYMDVQWPLLISHSSQLQTH
jgi:hypothetical protein